ncbi:hypothetical protein M4D79_13685 [Mycolicibacterium novocastrense]|nr:hypothetical protein M4D79_13685 [Mycolicibacterium novocastrense]
MTLCVQRPAAYLSMQANAAYPNIFVVLIGFYGLFFLYRQTAQLGMGPGVHLRPDRLHGLYARPDPQHVPGVGQRW